MTHPPILAHVLAISASSLGGPRILGANRKLHTEDRPLVQHRFDPDATAVHFDDLLGDGETKSRPAFGLELSI